LDFRETNLEQALIKNLESLGYTTLTSIQELSLEYSLNQKDIIALAKTGSGKTLAFSLAIANNLNQNLFRVQTLILAPTRELANQISNELRAVLRHIPNIKVLTLCGGVPFNPQALSLKHQAHIVVGTTGRVLKHIKEKNLNLENISTFVLDEADKMLDMGFYDDIIEIAEKLPKNRQTMLFSATYEKNIESLANTLLNKPKFIEVKNEEKNLIKQLFYNIKNLDKMSLIKPIIKQNEAKTTIIFCNQKSTCEKLADFLYDDGLDILTLHSDLDQRQRDETLTLFSNKSYPILIASDVASRGLDIDSVDLVINYDLALNEKIHTHRIGRTARAGKGGVAVSLYEDNELNRVLEIKEIFQDILFCEIETLNKESNFKIDSDFRTICINAGKKQKLRKLDIVGVLTSAIGLDKNDIGKIDIFDFSSFVAIREEKLFLVLTKLNKTKIKGKFYKIYEK